MVGISDVKGDAVNFRDREGGAKEATATPTACRRSASSTATRRRSLRLSWSVSLSILPGR